MANQRSTRVQEGILWELLHGVAKSQLIGKPKRVDHPCDISVTLGPQVRASQLTSIC